MMMSTARLRDHLEPLLGVGTVRTIRIGTKTPAYWPHRFVNDVDADDALCFYEQIVRSGRTLAVMAHFSHPRELGTDLARRSLKRIRETGAVVYCQAPLIRNVNDDPQVWVELWCAELAAGAVPYYLFVARDTGPHDYFKVPLVRAVDIMKNAYQRLPGLSRTVRGPVMSATPGKIIVDGVESTSNGRFFNFAFCKHAILVWSGVHSVPIVRRMRRGSTIWISIRIPPMTSLRQFTAISAMAPTPGGGRRPSGTARSGWTAEFCAAPTTRGSPRF